MSSNNWFAEPLATNSRTVFIENIDFGGSTPESQGMTPCDLHF